MADQELVAEAVFTALADPNRRAILALEKGSPGEQAFNQAFAAWKQ